MFESTCVSGSHRLVWKLVCLSVPVSVSDWRLFTQVVMMTCASCHEGASSSSPTRRWYSPAPHPPPLLSPPSPFSPPRSFQNRHNHCVLAHAPPASCNRTNRWVLWRRKVTNIKGLRDQLDELNQEIRAKTAGPALQSLKRDLSSGETSSAARTSLCRYSVNRQLGARSHIVLHLPQNATAAAPTTATAPATTAATRTVDERTGAPQLPVALGTLSCTPSSKWHNFLFFVERFASDLIVDDEEMTAMHHYVHGGWFLSPLRSSLDDFHNR